MQMTAPDIAIVGGGVVGLWCARLAAQRGVSVLLLEADRIGSGASGGILGALMPHQPVGWNAKKQVQLDGLTGLPGLIGALEAETGQTTGYAQVGRIMPIGHAHRRRQSEQWADGAAERWPNDKPWTVTDTNPAPGWLNGSAAPHGVNHDRLSARIQPRLYVQALRQSIAHRSHVTIRERCAVAGIAPDGRLHLSDGTTIGPGKTIVAAGCGSFALLDAEQPGRHGRGVKGQGALLKPQLAPDPAAPILFDNGTYVIAHDNGLVAVGSTSENEFVSGTATDDQLDALIDRARALCPALDGADIVERWAGVRPRAAGRDPLVGPIPGAPGTFVATGAFKITFAIAHLMADAAVALCMGEKPANLPDSFVPALRSSG